MTVQIVNPRQVQFLPVLLKPQILPSPSVPLISRRHSLTSLCMLEYRHNKNPPRPPFSHLERAHKPQGISPHLTTRLHTSLLYIRLRSNTHYHPPESTHPAHPELTLSTVPNQTPPHQRAHRKCHMPTSTRPPTTTPTPPHESPPGTSTTS